MIAQMLRASKKGRAESSKTSESSEMPQSRSRSRSCSSGIDSREKEGEEEWVRKTGDLGEVRSVRISVSPCVEYRVPQNPAHE
jgi:hypothetical protein